MTARRQNLGIFYSQKLFIYIPLPEYAEIVKPQRSLHRRASAGAVPRIKKPANYSGGLRAENILVDLFTVPLGHGFFQAQVDPIQDGVGCIFDALYSLVIQFTQHPILDFDFASRMSDADAQA